MGFLTHFFTFCPNSLLYLVSFLSLFFPFLGSTFMHVQTLSETVAEIAWVIQSCIINVQDMPLGSNMIIDSVAPYMRKMHAHTFCWKPKANLLLPSTTLVLEIFIFMTFNLILYDFHLSTAIRFYYKLHLKFILQDNRLIIQTLFIKCFKYHYQF